MKKERNPEKLPILLDTNNPWQVVLIVLITLALTVAIRFGLYLVERSGVLFENSQRYSTSKSDEFDLDYYKAMLKTDKKTEKATAQEAKLPGVTTIETEKNEKGVYVPKATPVPESYRDALSELNANGL